MTATVHENSDLMANLLAVPPLRNARWMSKAVPYREYFHQTRVAAGGAGSKTRLCKLPTGAMIILGDSKIMHTDAGGTVTGALGWEAYKLADGTVVAEDIDGLCAGLDISGQASALGLYWTASTTISADYRIFGGDVVIVLSCSGDMPAALIVSGWITYAMPH